MSRSLSRHLVGATLALAAAAAFAAPVPVLKFEGAIGVDPLTAAGGVDALNVVRGINPGGRAWVIRKFDATVYSDGSIAARGKGLLFSSGDVIATAGPVTHVAATLACGPAATPTLYTTAPTPLNASGNFKIAGPLLDGANPAVLPATCDNPQLLIRAANAVTGAAGGWFAVGILERDDD